MPCFSVLLEAFYLGMMPELKRRHAELLSEQRTEVGGFPESEFKGQITDGQAVILLQETARFLKFQVQQILPRSFPEKPLPVAEKCAARHPVMRRQFHNINFLFVMQLEIRGDAADSRFIIIRAQNGIIVTEYQQFQKLECRKVDSVGHAEFMRLFHQIHEFGNQLVFLCPQMNLPDRFLRKGKHTAQGGFHFRGIGEMNNVAGKLHSKGMNSF